MRNTKIVATVGPASRSPEMLRALLTAGVDVFRLNMSHGVYGEHTAVIQHIRQIAAESGATPAILLDLQGPKIRLGKFEEGEALLETGAAFTITVEELIGNAQIASTSYKALARDVSAGDRVLLADGTVELRALATNGVAVNFTVVSGGPIRNNQGINLPGVRVSIPSMTEKDCADLEFGLSQNVDLVALSFVRNGEDVAGLKRRLKDRGHKIPVIAKIEKPEALDNLEGILTESDGVMVARGDLGVEMTLARVPGAQKTIIERARMRGKFVITATQMLESMVTRSTPTRAEVTDVANAIFDGTDAVMLSAETASGQYPLEAVRMMATIACEAENYQSQRHFPEPPQAENPSHAQIITQAAYHAGLSAGVTALVAFTTSGETARLIARFRPRVPIFAFCETAAVAREVAVVYGVHPIAPVSVESIEEMLRVCDLKLLGEAWSRIGDSVILVAGAPFGKSGSANLIKLHHVGQVSFQESLE
jgi:pyruvate kinase